MFGSQQNLILLEHVFFSRLFSAVWFHFSQEQKVTFQLENDRCFPFMIPFCYFLHYTPHQKAILISELRKDERKHEGNKNEV